MDPNNPYQAAPPPQGQGQYDFITNPAKPRKKGPFGLGGGGKNNILVTVIAGLVLLTVILLLGSLFLGGEDNKDALLRVAQKQSQVIAVAQLGADDGGSTQAQALGAAVLLSVSSDQQSVLAQITKNDKVKDSEYRAEPSSEVTQQLETAEVNGRFDEAFYAAIKAELEEYQGTLQEVNASISSKSAKEILAQSFDNATVLLKIQTN